MSHVIEENARMRRKRSSSVDILREGGFDEIPWYDWTLILLRSYLSRAQRNSERMSAAAAANAARMQMMKQMGAKKGSKKIKGSENSLA